MARSLLLAVLALFLVGCAAPGAPDPQVSGLRGAVQYAVGHTVKLTDSGCTGVNIGAGRLVTAKHCTDDGAAAGDSFAGGKLLHVSPSYDFVVVDTSADIAYAVDRIYMRPYDLGEHVYVVGYPMQLEDAESALTVTDGIMAGPVDSDSQARLTAPVYFGNSGGGVWGDDGALLGIAVAIYAATPPNVRYPIPYAAQAYMVPITLVRPYL